MRKAVRVVVIAGIVLAVVLAGGGYWARTKLRASRR